MRTIGELLEQKGREIFSISPDSSVFDAIKLMAERGIGALVVTENEKLVGILSERDYARKVILMNRASRETPVRDIMTSKVISGPRSLTIHEAMGLMTDHRIRHLPIVEDDEVKGVISIGDLVKAIIDEQRFQIQQLESYITQ